jgi:hypothetical protein
VFLRSSSSSFLLLRPLFLEAKTNSLLPDDENKEEDVVEDEVDAIADDTLLVNILVFLFCCRGEEVVHTSASAFIKDKTCEESERERERERDYFFFGGGDETWRNDREPIFFALFSSILIYLGFQNSILPKKRKKSRDSREHNTKMYEKDKKNEE